MTLSDTDTAQLWETFRAGGGAELVRGAVRLVLQELIEAEATKRKQRPRSAIWTLASPSTPSLTSRLIVQLRWLSLVTPRDSLSDDRQLDAGPCSARRFQLHLADLPLQHLRDAKHDPEVLVADSGPVGCATTQSCHHDRREYSSR